MGRHPCFPCFNPVVVYIEQFRMAEVMKYTFALWCAILLHGLCTGQALISSSQLLAASRLEPAYTIQGQHLTYIDDVDPHLPYINQISLRTQTDRFDPARQEYALRFNFNGLGEIAKTNEAQQSDVSSKAGLQRLYLQESLLRRYEGLASYHYRLRRLTVERALKQLFTDKANVLKKSGQLDGETDVDEFIKNEFDLDQIDLDIAEDESSLDYNLELMKSSTPSIPGEWLPDTTGFITIAQIEVQLSQIPDTITNHPQLAIRQAKAGEIDAEYALEKAKSNQVLDFVQLRYANIPNLQDLQREFSLGFSFLMPFNGTSQLKMKELLIEKDEAYQNMLLYQNDLNERMTRAHLKLEALLRQYHLAEKKLEEHQNQFNLDEGLLPMGDAALLLLSARELQLKRQLNLLSLENDIMDEYIGLLDLTGMLSAMPSVNYLSASFETY